MESDKEKLRNRLNVRFEPFPNHRYSLKKLHVERLSKEKDKEASIISVSKNRSISIRLPAVDHKATVVESKQTTVEHKLPPLDVKPPIEHRPTESETKLQLSRLGGQAQQPLINFKQLKMKIKSMRQIPQVKVESRAPIHDTLTYLLRNQILTIPKIVALLKQSQSEQFIYMRVKGIYQYEVCSQQDKGGNYITVSSSGMVSDGLVIPLQDLVHEFEVYTKLSKVHFFKYYTFIKYINMWRRGSKKAHFIQNRNRIKRELYLDNNTVIAWKKEIRNVLLLDQQFGGIFSGWAARVAKVIENKKGQIDRRLTSLNYRMLEKFNLSLSESQQLLNKTLGDLKTLKLTFEVKIRIEREMEIIYKVGRSLQFQFMHSVGEYVLRHIQAVRSKLALTNSVYQQAILKKLEKLNHKDQDYGNKKQRLLANAVVAQQVSYNLSLNDDGQLQISPSAQQIYLQIMKGIRQFIDLVDRSNFRLIRTNGFAFILNNVLKSTVNSTELVDKQMILRDYLAHLSDYSVLLHNLEIEIDGLHNIFIRRLSSMSPFVNIYHETVNKLEQQPYKTYGYEDIKAELQDTFERIRFSDTGINQGQYFVNGFLNLSAFKQKVLDKLNVYLEELTCVLPKLIKDYRTELCQQLYHHNQIMHTIVNSPDNFIIVAGECEVLELNILDYIAKLAEIQMIQELYQSVKKIEPNSLAEEKGLIAELKSKMKNFKDSKDHLYLLYRKDLQAQRVQLIARVSSFNQQDERFYVLTGHPEEVYRKAMRRNQSLSKTAQQLKHLNSLQEFYNLKQTELGKLDNFIAESQSLLQIWYIYKQWKGGIEFMSRLNIINVKCKTELKQYQGFMRKVQKRLKTITYYEVCKHLHDGISALLDCLYVVDDLQNSVLRKKDYEEISKLYVKQRGITTEDVFDIISLTFGEAMHHKLPSMRASILQIIFKSRKQQQIERSLAQFNTWWKEMKLQGHTLEQYPLIIVFEDNAHIRNEIEEYSTLLLNIVNHKYGAFARKQCVALLRQIQSLAAMLELAVVHQERFLALYPILTSKYAEKQLPNEFNKFNSILRKTMKNLKWLQKPTENLNQTTKALLNNHIKQFETISKILSSFLQRKRVKFQRFYFLQDDQMLQVLVGIAGQNNIFRMFEGIKGWVIDREGIKCGVQGIGNERLMLRGWSYKNLEPEIVFKSLEDSIKTNLNSIVRGILHSYENEMKQLKNLYHKMPWMSIYTVQLILFTKQIELNCFHNQIGLQVQANLVQETINSYSANALDNANFITLQLFLLHFTQQLKLENVQSVFDFQWNSFLRYYYEKDGVIMRVLGADHLWGGEYQGSWHLMINTSDIRRAHACVLLNIKYGNGVLLQGPSGTGKTQSLKELARCMAKYCVLFNCSSEVNIRTLQKLLSGLCYTASWLCLDQINRLTSGIMSVVANQVMIIKNAIVNKKQVVNFTGKDIKLRSGVGIFSTMNPIYLKRAKLTENLKGYFRVISVSTPDYQKILQVLMYSLGFANATQHSHKISKLFKNLSIQLRESQQYDFGLRAMKSFVYNLSLLPRKAKSDQQVITQCLYNTFFSRLQPSDEATFKKVVLDAFGKTVDMLPEDFKVKYIREAPQTGIIVLGETSTKTTLIKDYCLSFKEQKTEVTIFNTNSVEIQHFIGETVLGRWEPGLAEKVARKSFDNPEEIHILVLDNQLRSEIIQNFNSLLDDSKLLSLSNGTRLKVHDNFKIVMETTQLTMTSPATITRCAVINVSEADVFKERLVSQSLPYLSEDASQKLQTILMKFSLQQIRRIRAIYPLLTRKDLKLGKKGEQLSDSDAIGIEKSLIYSIQLLGWGHIVSQHLHKDNALSAKKNIYHYILSFDRVPEGEFVELPLTAVEMPSLHTVYVHNVRSRFIEYMNLKAYQKCKQLLWKSQRGSGNTTAIMQCFSSDKFSKKNIAKVHFDKHLSTKTFITLLQQRIITKSMVFGNEDPLLIYVDNLHLANDETREYLRYMIEYGKGFNVKKNEISVIAPFVMVADCSSRNRKEYTARVCRHFAELYLPICEDDIMKNIFSVMLQSAVKRSMVNSEVKQLFEGDLQRISLFLIDYVKKNNAAYDQAVTNGRLDYRLMSYYDMSNLINSLSKLSDQIADNVSSLMTFFFSELRTRQVELKRSSLKQLELLKMAKSEVLKNKYTKEFDDVFKMQSGHPSESRQYFSLYKGYPQPIINWQSFRDKMYEGIKEQYISESILLELLQILRVLNWAGGNYYLVGPTSIGKTTTLQLAARLSNVNVTIWHPLDDKRASQSYFAILKKAISKGKKEAILVDIGKEGHDGLLLFMQRLTAGYPAQMLLSPEDADYAYATIEQLKSLGYDKLAKPFDVVVQDFMNFARQQVVLLFFSPADFANDFIQQHHYLMKQTSIRFFEVFPSEAIVEISNRILGKKTEDVSLSEQQNLTRLTGVFLKLFGDMNELVARNNCLGITHLKYNPYAHFKCLEKYKKIISTVNRISKEKEEILNKSIVKVHETTEIIDRLKEIILEAEPQVKQKRQQIMAVVPILEDQKKASEEVKALVESQHQQIEAKRVEIETIMHEVETKIAKSEPLLQDANDSLSTIKRNDLSEIKNNANPHPLIKFMMQNMVILLGEVETWDNIKKVLSDTNLIIKIKSCSPTLAMALKVKQRCQENHEWNVQNISKIAYGSRFMFRWINGVIKFTELKANIDRQKQYVEELQIELKKSEENARKKQAQLTSKEQNLRLIGNDYQQSKNQLGRLQVELESNQRRLENAEKIINGLKEEVSHWINKLRELKEFRKTIEGSSILITAFLCIYPALLAEEHISIDAKLRESLKKWQFAIPENFNTFTFVKEEIMVDRDNWIKANRQKMGLPKSLLSMEMLSNERIKYQKVTQALYYIDAQPLFLDPNNIAMNWLQMQTRGGGNEGRVITTKESFAMSTRDVETAFTQGYVLVLLIEDCINSFTRDVLEAKTTIIAEKKMVEYNKNMLTVHPDFKVLLCNKSLSPDLEPELYTQYNVINFQITETMLKLKLLAEVINLQNPSISLTLNALQLQRKKNKAVLLELDKQIVQSLINNKTQLVDDLSFISLLQQAKAKAEHLQLNEAELANRMTTIKAYSDVYISLCEQVSRLFISFNVMNNINSLLSWNADILLQYFLWAVKDSISSPLFTEDDDQQPQFGVGNIDNYKFEHYNAETTSRATSALSYVSRSQSPPKPEEVKAQSEEKPDPKLFASLISAKEMIIDESQKGTMSKQRKTAIINRLIKLVRSAFNEDERKIWALILSLTQSKQDIRILLGVHHKRVKLKDYLQSCQLTDQKKAFINRCGQHVDQQIETLLTSQNPFRSTQLSEVEILLLCRLSKPQLFSKLCDMLAANKNLKSILDYSEQSVGDWLQHSDNRHPILLIMGEDPLQRISEYVTRKKYKNVVMVVMGEGQGKVAEIALEKESHRENLVIIHNLHIVQSFLPYLAKTLQQFRIRPPHENFRLILISSKVQALNSSIASYCHKYILQQPTGLHQQMRYLQAQMPVEFTHPSHLRIAYSLSFLHAVINCLLRYNCMGWNMSYRFGTADFISAVKVLKEVLECRRDITRYECNIDTETLQEEIDLENIDFKGLKYLIGEVSYVGKLADDIDRQKMRILIDKYLSSEKTVGEKGDADYLHLPHLGDKEQLVKGSKIKEEIEKAIVKIPQDDSRVLGLHSGIRPNCEDAEYILRRVDQGYKRAKKAADQSNLQSVNPIQPLNHKFEYINQEIRRFNEICQNQHADVSTNTYDNSLTYAGKLLRNLTTDSKVFNLCAFTNPRQFFISIAKEVAHRNNVVYDRVELVWSVQIKEIVGLTIYGVQGLRLQGAMLHPNGCIDDGISKDNITLYVYGSVKKKEQNKGRKLVSIPMYLNSERHGKINSYGDNTNLLIKVKLESEHSQEFCTLRSMAFIVQ